jgi:hypothetical protein
MAVANLFVLLLGAGLLAIPIILHLLMQPKPKPLVFPGLRFLQKTASSNRRQLRVRQWVLLLLRCLLLLLLALALAGPAVAAAAYANWLWVIGIGALWLVASLVVYAVWTNPKRARGLLPAMAALWLLLGGWLGWNVKQAWSAGGGQTLGQAESPVSALILIDNAPRMSYRDGGTAAAGQRSLRARHARRRALLLGRHCGRKKADHDPGDQLPQSADS